MNSNELWLKQLSLGKQGEAAVKQFLLSHGYDVIDISDEEKYFKDDTDFIVDGALTELKTDTRIAATNNLFIEDKKVMQDGFTKDGWFHYTKAKWLLYLDWNNKILYKYDMQQLKQYIANNKQRIPYRCCNDKNKKVWGYCVNKDAIPHETAQL